MKHFLLLFVSLVSISTYACGNEYGNTAKGEKRYDSYSFLHPYRLKFNSPQIESRIAEIELQLQKDSTNFKHWSDLSLNLMKKGQVDSALSILKPLALKYPKEYIVIANLGTAHELKNELDSALKYISKGLKLNPNSHRGSEWVHVAILKAKINRRKNKNHILKTPIITENLFFTQVKDSTRKNYFSHVQRQIMYQIETRAPFTPAPNQVITNLFLNLAKLNFKYGTVEGGFAALIQAEFFNDNSGIQKEIEQEYDAISKKRQSLQFKENKSFERTLKHMRLTNPKKYLTIWNPKMIPNKKPELDSSATLVSKVEPIKKESTPPKKMVKPEIQEEKQTTKDSNWSLYLIGLTIVLLFFLRRFKNKGEVKN